MEEIWKDITNYNGYQASNLGRIRTYNKVTYTKWHGERHWENRILKFKPTDKTEKIKQGGGYRVSLWKDGKCKDFLVARLVATTFLENLIDTKMTVNHKNGNRLDNRVENLEWLTLSENIKYGFENNQYQQINIKLKNKNTNKISEFKSLSGASSFLGRSSGYINDCIKYNRKIKDIEKNEYEIIEINKIKSRF